jgi:hypothetical protein
MDFLILYSNEIYYLLNDLDYEIKNESYVIYNRIIYKLYSLFDTCNGGEGA